MSLLKLLEQQSEEMGLKQDSTKNSMKYYSLKREACRVSNARISQKNSIRTLWVMVLWKIFFRIQV